MSAYNVSNVMKYFVPWLALIAGAPVLAQDIPKGRTAAAELALSNDTLQLRYYDNTEGSQRRLIGGAFLGEERDVVLNAGLLYPVELGSHFDIAIGPNVYAALLNDENQDVMAVSLGAELRWFLDSSRRFAISGQAFYSPDILTFGASDGVADLSARAEWRLSDRADVFGGMRWFEFDLIDGAGEQTLQEELFFGLRYRL